MQSKVTSVRRDRNVPRSQSSVIPCIALNECQLATRWGLSVKTLRRWRQQQIGPIFCKLGARVTYLISEIEAYERRVSRYSTSAQGQQCGGQS